MKHPVLAMVISGLGLEDGALVLVRYEGREMTGYLWTLASIEHILLPSIPKITEISDEVEVLAMAPYNGDFNWPEDWPEGKLVIDSSKST